jgi:hypothetical protein
LRRPKYSKIEVAAPKEEEYNIPCECGSCCIGKKW